MGSFQKIKVIDSHTGGEPTRLVIEGGPDLGSSPLKERLKKLQLEHDHFRSAVVNEPRGSEVMIGALLCQPVDPTCAAGVIFFNNVGYLGMCGHGTMGLVVTLAHMGRIGTGEHRIETPVGTVSALLDSEGKVTGGADKRGDAGTVISTTATGAGIGAIASPTPKGAGIGAGIGAAAGLAAILLTRGPEAELPRGSTMDVVLERARTLDGSQIQFTNLGQFQPVLQLPVRRPEQPQ